MSTSAAGAKPHLHLGPLEKRVLELLWGYGRAVTVRHVQLKFPNLAYTTLMTTLDRLYRKGVLLRRRHGRAFVRVARKMCYSAKLFLATSQTCSRLMTIMRRFFPRSSMLSVARMRHCSTSLTLLFRRSVRGSNWRKHEFRADALCRASWCLRAC